MRVTLLVDALTPRLSGIGRYTWELSRRLPHQEGIDRLDFYSNGRFVEDVASLVDGEAAAPRKPWPSWLARRINRNRLRIERNRLRSSLVHGPNYFLPSEVESGIITVHDLSVLRFPETHPPERVTSFERHFEQSLRRAAHVITDTETVRSEIVEQLGISADRVTAIALGVGSEFRPRAADEIQPGLSDWGLQAGAYVLCVSTLEPRKKIAELLRAWGDLPRPVRDRTPLVLAGGEGWLNAALHEQIERASAAGWLKHLGFVPESRLPALYAGAALFVYPSIYEGFGLPPVEAMASGVPVVVANRSCLPEVCGDAPAYVDPDDGGEFTTALAKALEDDAWRARARRLGLERAGSFTWDDCAAKTAALYRRQQW